MDNQKFNIDELIEKNKKIIEKFKSKDLILIAEIRANASKNPENISFNDMLDLKIDLELYGVENV